MNKARVFFFGLLLPILTAGCLPLSSGYTPDADLDEGYRGNRYAVTYSVECRSDGARCIGRADAKYYTDYLAEALRECGAFTEISHAAFDKKSDYHIHFIMHYSAMPTDQAVQLELFMVYTALGIPTWASMYLDASAVVYINGKPTHAPTTSERLRSIVWMPLLPVNLFWNQWWAWRRVEKRCCRYLIREVADYQSRCL